MAAQLQCQATTLLGRGEPWDEGGGDPRAAASGGQGRPQGGDEGRLCSGGRRRSRVRLRRPEGGGASREAGSDPDRGRRRRPNEGPRRGSDSRRVDPRDGGERMEAHGRTEGVMCKKCTHGGGSGGRLDAKISQISPLPSDGDPVAFVGVSKVSTKTLVSIRYGALLNSDGDELRRLFEFCCSFLQRSPYTLVNL